MQVKCANLLLILNIPPFIYSRCQICLSFSKCTQIWLENSRGKPLKNVVSLLKTHQTSLWLCMNSYSFTSWKKADI